MAALFFGNQFIRLVDIRLTKNFIFIAIAMIGALLFKFDTAKLKKHLPIWLTCLSIYALTLINAEYFFTIQFMSEIFQVTVGVLFFIMILNNYKPEYLKFITWCFASICILQSVWIILELHSIEPYMYIAQALNWSKEIQYIAPDGSKVLTIPMAGSLGNPMISSNQIALTLPFLLFTSLWPAVILVIWALYYTKSAAAVICSLIAIFYALHVRIPGVKFRYKLLLLLPISFGFCYFVHFNFEHFFANGERFAVWSQTITWFSDIKSIVFGKGIGFFYVMFAGTFKHLEAWIHPHNELVLIYNSFGLTGVVLALWSLGYLLTRKCAGILKLTLVLACVMASTGFPLHISALASIILFITAAILAENIENKEIRDGTFSNKKRNLSGR